LGFGRALRRDRPKRHGGLYPTYIERTIKPP
jgi:hypothetical protein